MNKRILAALLVALLLLFTFSSCGVPGFIIDDSTTEQTTTTKEQISLPPVVDGSYFEAHFIDVGQADAALVICDGHAMLIDGGNRADSNLIYAYLKKYEVSHLDYVISTHPHEDHVGGISGALTYATFDKVYSPVTTFTTSAFKNFANRVKAAGKELTLPTPGESFLLGSAKVTILGPLHFDYENVNNISIVLRIEYGDLAFLFTGDMESAAELDLIKKGVNLEADVLKVGHHGSGSSSYYQFLRAVKATYGVISCGRNNEYGHPHSGPLSRLRDADVKLYRTDMQGDIVCRSTDGKTLTFTTQMNPEAVTNPTAAQNDTSYLPTYLYYDEKFN